jgi:hypothetical protein
MSLREELLALGLGVWQETHLEADASFLTRQVSQSHCPSFLEKAAPKSDTVGSVVGATSAVNFAEGLGV